MADTNNIENLPDELLVHIFSYGLENCKTIFGIIKYCITLQRTCKKFYNLLKNDIYIQGLLNKKAKSLPPLKEEEIVKALKRFIINKNYELIDILCYFDFLQCHHIDYAIALKDEPSLEKIEIFLYIINKKQFPFHQSSTLLSVFQYIAEENDVNKKEILKKIALRLTQAGFRIDTFKGINDAIQTPIISKTNYVDFTFYFKSNLFIKDAHMPNALTNSISNLCNNTDINYLREKYRIVKFLVEQSISPSLLENSMKNLIKMITTDHLQFFHPEIPYIAVKIYQNSLSGDHKEISFRQGHLEILLLGVEIAIKTKNSFAIIFFSNAYFSHAIFSKKTLSAFCKNLNIKLKNKKPADATTLIIGNYNCLLELKELLNDNFINNMHVSNSSKRIIKNFINFSRNKLHFLPNELLADWHEHCQSNNKNPTEILVEIITPGQINYVQNLFKKHHSRIYEDPYKNSFEEYLKMVSKRNVENEDDNYLIHGY